MSKFNKATKTIPSSQPNIMLLCITNDLRLICFVLFYCPYNQLIRDRTPSKKIKNNKR